jgi:hypothetical protein
MKLCPAFFQNHYPDLFSPSRLGKQRSTLGIDGDIVIDNNLSKNTLIQYSCHIDTMRVNFEVREQILYPKIIFSQC